jgi:hypothetical protein
MRRVKNERAARRIGPYIKVFVLFHAPLLCAALPPALTLFCFSTSIPKSFTGSPNNLILVRGESARES